MWSTRRPRGFELDRAGFVGHLSQVLELRVGQSSLVGRTILAKSPIAFASATGSRRRGTAGPAGDGPRGLPVGASVMTVPCSYAPGCINLNWDYDSQALGTSVWAWPPAAKSGRSVVQAPSLRSYDSDPGPQWQVPPGGPAPNHQLSARGLGRHKPARRRGWGQ
jgi:hypothetical protein